MCIEGQKGVSLIELILFIVIVSVALVAIIKAFEVASIGSADPVLRRQSLAIAQALVEEISYKPVTPPDGGLACPSSFCNASTRSQFDDVMDYNGLFMQGIRDLAGHALTGLESYRVDVAVSSNVAFGSVPATAGYRIRVTVTDPRGEPVVVETYRANY